MAPVVETSLASMARWYELAEQAGALLWQGVADLHDGRPPWFAPCAALRRAGGEAELTLHSFADVAELEAWLGEHSAAAELVVLRYDGGGEVSVVVPEVGARRVVAATSVVTCDLGVRRARGAMVTTRVRASGRAPMAAHAFAQGLEDALAGHPAEVRLRASFAAPAAPAVTHLQQVAVPVAAARPDAR